MKYIFIFIVLNLSQNAFQQAPNIHFKETKPPESYIIISGKTNINQFELYQFIPEKNLPKINEQHEPENYLEKHNTFSIPLKNFSASNQLIYNDFLELMKANQHPEIQIGISGKEVYDLFMNKNYVNPELEIRVAGVSHTYKFPCEKTLIKQNKIFLTGSYKILLTDFKIDPPVKTMELIRVENEVIINFGLFFSM